MKYIIRKVKKEDLSRLIELCKSHAEHEKSYYNSLGKQKALEILLFNKPTLFCYIIEIEQKSIGYFSYTFDISTWDARPYLHLDCLYLEPECRGMRIGTTIINYLIKIAQQNNCINIQWQTPIFNEEAIKFYNKTGALKKEKIRFSLGII